MKITDRIRPRAAARTSVSALASEIWAAPHDRVSALLDEIAARLDGITAREMREAMSAHEDATPYAVESGVAHLQLRGPMMPRVPWIFTALGIEATSTEGLRDAIAIADADESVHGIVLHVDSPGGTVSGTPELADAIASAQTPIVAHAQGIMASAAYWVASQASRVTASTSALAGSIGAFAVVADTSRLFAEAGIKVHVLRSGEHKGAGVAGDDVTAAQLAQMQATVDTAADMFIDAIAQARDVPGLAELADGRVFFAADAAEHQLIDGVEDAETAALAATPQGEQGMNEEQIKALIDAQVAPLKAELAKSNDALEEARGRAETAEQKAKAHEDALMASRKSACDAAIARGVETGRITATNRASVDAFADAVGGDPMKVEAFVGSLHPAVRPDAQGGLPPEDDTGISDEQAEFWGLSSKELAACRGDVRISMDGGKFMRGKRTFKALGEVN